MVRGRLAEEKGVQMVEFALIAPILIYLLLMVPVLGMLVRAWVVVEIAAREGARALAVSGSERLACQRAIQEVTLYGGLPRGSRDELFSPDMVTYNAASGRVTVAYRQPTYLPGLPLLVGGDPLEERITVRGEASFLPEYQIGGSPPPSRERRC